MGKKFINRELFENELLNDNRNSISPEAVKVITELLDRQRGTSEEEILNALIRTSERLPLDHGKYLVVYKQDEKTVFDVAYYSLTGQWVKLTGGYITNVSHWADLNSEKSLL